MQSLRPSLQFFRAQALIFFKAHGRALDALQELVREAPEHRRAWGILGFLLAEKERYADAIGAFERAIALSAGRDLTAKVEYARRYARIIYDRPLHDRLLREVLAAETVAPGLTLGNVLAQRQAKELLASADSYF